MIATTQSFLLFLIANFLRKKLAPQGYVYQLKEKTSVKNVI